MNVEIRKLEETIIHAVNASQVPTEAKRLVVADVLRKLEVQAEKDILVLFTVILTISLSWFLPSFVANFKPKPF